MLGLPEIRVNFETKAVTAVQRSERGIVALILKDTGTFDTKVYKSIEDISDNDWSAGNLDYIKKTFLGIPSKIICEKVEEEATDYKEALKRLNSKKFNYLAIPSLTAEQTSDIMTWIKTKRDNEHKTFKAVLPNCKGDHEGIINFTSDNIKVGSKNYTTSEYCCRMAGILAGLSLKRSATYYVLNEVEFFDEVEDIDNRIDAGELVLFNEDGEVKIARAVNSFVSFTPKKAEDYRKIKIVEAIDLMKDDIRETFRKYYVGKVINSYENQRLFFGSISAYFEQLALDGILEKKTEENLDRNKADVNIPVQRLAWKAIKGEEVDLWSDKKVKENTFRSKVFMTAKVKVLDAMEDLDFTGILE
ncbi:phage tail sheath C-terminal domain-containing protein [Anaerophilus nitritogenes]|uniref:phage tail sheath C-terminal domain-containing protein n=1 Tax=Anaerophilus nitritogenes TaxID=2498136 RepID=UPI00101C36A1|nr:phage tail sheath C-terminal domain-containing protein [Anaerophilus nitritogenes]